MKHRKTRATMAGVARNRSGVPRRNRNPILRAYDAEIQRILRRDNGKVLLARGRAIAFLYMNSKPFRHRNTGFGGRTMFYPGPEQAKHGWPINLDVKPAGEPAAHVTFQGVLGQ